MTTDLPHGTPIVHVNCVKCPKLDHAGCTHVCPHGPGTVSRMIGHTVVVAYWVGIPMARHEPREGVTRWTPPAPPVRRRRSA